MFALLILKLLFPSIFCWYFRYFVSETISGSTITSAYIYNRCSFLSLLMVWHYKRQYADKTLTLRKYMYMRASELRKCLHFHIKKLPFLSIFCWYLKNFVGTNDILGGLHVPTDFQMYRQKLRKSIIGGQLPPPPAPLWLR